MCCVVRWMVPHEPLERLDAGRAERDEGKRRENANVEPVVPVALPGDIHIFIAC